MKKLFFLTILIFLSQITFAQNEKSKIQGTILGVFNGMSLLNEDTLRYYTTSDFHLLESGKIWNMDTILKKIRPLKKDPNFHRLNKIDFIRIHFNHDNAWVTYYNTAEITSADRSGTLKWMESAVLIKEDGHWKIQMLHSTPLK